jgi:hypothetical protein
LIDILTFDGFFGGIFDILTPKWLPTAAQHATRQIRISKKVRRYHLNLPLAATVIHSHPRTGVAINLRRVVVYANTNLIPFNVWPECGHESTAVGKVDRNLFAL